MAQERIHQLFGKFEADAIFRRMQCHDQLGQPYHYKLEILSVKADLSPYDAIGQKMAVGIIRDGFPPRYFHGLISSFEYQGPTGGYHAYSIELRPELWKLKFSYDCKIYQNKTVLEIIEDVIKSKNGIVDLRTRVNAQMQSREYCVQYRESDFDFITRLMEQEGIHYFFEHEKTKHTLVLVDENDAVPVIKGDATILYRPPNELLASDEHIFRWTHHVAFQTGKTVLRDYDYTKTQAKLESNAVSGQSHVVKTIERYDYPGEFALDADGTRYAKIQVQSLDAHHTNMQGLAHSYRLVAGSRFKLAEHPVSKDNKEYVVIESDTDVQSGEIEHFGPDSENRIEVSFRVVPQTVPYRSPRATAAPIIAGPQTARVVGKQNDEIWTDNMGRIKVQFHWDRVGQNDENSSCWIRVAQYWAGQNWGSWHLPRIGQEVVVEFLEGDPDRPLVTGSVYNDVQQLPYNLPGDAAHSGIKSRSTKEGNAETFNELRFEDTKDQEKVYFHAEKDFVRVVENNDELTVGNDKKDPGNQTITIFNNQAVTVGGSDAGDGSQTVTVWKNQTETIKTGDRAATIEKGNDSLKITVGNQTIEIGGTCEITANQKLTLKVGASTIVMDPQSITIKAPTVTIEGDIKAEVKSVATDVAGTGVLKLQGGVVKIN